MMYDDFIVVSGGYLKDEYDENTKILKLNCNDGYIGLSEKVIKTFHFILSNNFFEKYTHFIKLDDDICFIDINNFEKFIEGRLKSNSFLYSANVINNNHLSQHEFDNLHKNFITNYENILNKNNTKDIEIFSNDKRLSINFVSFLGKDLKYINEEFSNGIGSNDEWRLCHDIPTRIGKQN